MDEDGSTTYDSFFRCESSVRRLCVVRAVLHLGSRSSLFEQAARPAAHAHERLTPSLTCAAAMCRQQGRHRMRRLGCSVAWLRVYCMRTTRPLC
jgi:hypothetical protein